VDCVIAAIVNAIRRERTRKADAIHGSGSTLAKRALRNLSSDDVSYESAMKILRGR
jgi:hypothetical protein